MLPSVKSVQRVSSVQFEGEEREETLERGFGIGERKRRPRSSKSSRPGLSAFTPQRGAPGSVGILAGIATRPAGRRMGTKDETTDFTENTD